MERLYVAVLSDHILHDGLLIAENRARRLETITILYARRILGMSLDFMLKYRRQQKGGGI